MTAETTAQAKETGSDVGLAEILAPVDVETFCAAYFDVERLHCRRADDSYYGDLGSRDRMLAMLSVLPPGCIDMAYDGVPLSKSEFVSPEGVQERRVRALHDMGATIILRSVHRYDAALMGLLRQVTKFFCAPAQMNVYLSPPGPASTPPHWDTHDLFVLQTAGRKIWNLYDCGYSRPLLDQRFDESDYALGDLSDSVAVEAGDMLYLPRGSVHEPQAEDYSVHVAVGLHVRRFVDVAQSILEGLALEDVRWRRTPFRTSPDQVEQLLSVLQSGLAAATMRRDDQRSARSPVPDQQSDVGPRTKLRANACFMVHDQEGNGFTPVMRGRPGYELRSEEEWFRKLAQGHVVEVRELGSGLRDQERLALARALLDTECVVVAGQRREAGRVIPGADEF